MSPKKKNPKPKMRPPRSGVKVRMYDTGFGDCFLLAFRAKDRSPRYVLIDFGVHHLHPDRKERMPLIAKDIKKATGSKLHVVAVTHEHTDHLYGFKYGRDDFDDIDIDELWLPWTEDPDNEVAEELKERYGMRIRALHLALDQLKSANKPYATALQGLYEFETQADLMIGAGGNADQLDYLREKSTKKLERPGDYLYPGENPITIPDVEDVRIYILGPPEDVDWIKKLTKKSEMYPELTDIDELDAFAAAALASKGNKIPKNKDLQLFRRSSPFDKHNEISKKDAKERSEYRDFFKKYYGFTNRGGHGDQWRRIETDWLAVAERLALSINSKTNNTSLVLAIELTDTQPKKVLLFAADAQVGSWLSWHELEWFAEEEDVETVTTEDLLNRTVLYKTGHHGSRNATLKQKGLEMMESPDLIAMIPVDEEWANEEMNWEHPAEKLLNRIVEKTRGRVLRTDRIPKRGRTLEKPDEATQSEWRAFKKQVKWDRSKNKLWIQYTVSG